MFPQKKFCTQTHRQTPVSYTHLDVYKRQLLFSTSFPFLSCSFTLTFSASFFLPVTQFLQSSRKSDPTLKSIQTDKKNVTWKMLLPQEWKNISQQEEPLNYMLFHIIKKNFKIICEYLIVFWMNISILHKQTTLILSNLAFEHRHLVVPSMCCHLVVHSLTSGNC